MKTALFTGKTTRATATARVRFRGWLRNNHELALALPLPVLVRRYGRDISMSSAYRVALAEGVRGSRRNATRYAAFWKMINWDLPDSVLSTIWGVGRGNLRTRRVRLQLGSPRFDARCFPTSHSYHEAVSREKRRASHYRGPRPH